MQRSTIERARRLSRKHVESFVRAKAEIGAVNDPNCWLDPRKLQTHYVDAQAVVR